MADNQAGLFEIDRHIARLRKVGDLPREAAPACAEALREYLERQIAAGRAPDGSTWAPRKEDGGRALEDAAKALTVVPVGTHILARIKGPEARHHKGIAKGGTVRQILPTTTIPPVLTRALDAVIKETFVRTMESR
jgi:hypothetical protein